MSIVWPYPFRNDGQWRRIDQGQDLQVPVGTPVLAIADGTIGFGHDPHGFGDPYPVLTFDVPQGGHTAAYYGHSHPEQNSGTHVAQGQVVAYAAQVPGGNAANLPGWLELGWWGGSGPTGDGQNMHDTLKAAPVWAQGDDLAVLSPEAQTYIDQNNAKWAYEDQGFLKQAMSEMEARLNARIDKVCGKST